MKNNLLTTSSKLIFTKSNIVNGAIIYSVGDAIASLFLNEFSWYRFLGMLIVGATIYAFEIPNVFAWIERKTISMVGVTKTLVRTALAVAYFNPLWVARHLLFIKLFSGQFDQINGSLMKVAFWSFLANIPISFLANYFIQNKIKFNWRFIASGVFSALMAIYYAFSDILFNS